MDAKIRHGPAPSISAASPSSAGRPRKYRGDSETGPYQSPMEDGMRHFHEWYRREMNIHASD